MAAEYLTARYPEGYMPRTTKRPSMLRRTRGFITPPEDHPRRRSRLKEAGEDWNPWKSPQEIYLAVQRRTAEMGVGRKLILQRERDFEQFSIRELEVTPTGPDLGCAPALEAIHYALWDEFKDLRSGGRYVCRYVQGTRTVSKHGYRSNDWQGAAEDVFVSNPNTMEHLYEVTNFAIRETVAGRLEVARAIVGQGMWSPNTGWDSYPGEFHRHAHLECIGGFACNP